MLGFKPENILARLLRLTKEAIIHYLLESAES